MNKIKIVEKKYMENKVDDYKINIAIYSEGKIAYNKKYLLKDLKNNILYESEVLDDINLYIIKNIVHYDIVLTNNDLMTLCSCYSKENAFKRLKEIKENDIYLKEFYNWKSIPIYTIKRFKKINEENTDIKTIRVYTENEIEILKRVVIDYENIKNEINNKIQNGINYKDLQTYIESLDTCNFTNVCEKYTDFNYKDMTISIYNDENDLYLGDTIEVYNDKEICLLDTFNNIEEIKNEIELWEKINN